MGEVQRDIYFEMVRDIFFLVARAIGHIGLMTRVQDWTRVRILTGPMATGHWTEAEPLMLLTFFLNLFLMMWS